MAGRIKHMERSHKTRNKNYSEFRRFNIKAQNGKYSKSEMATFAERVLSGIRSMFKRQAKGDK